MNIVNARLRGREGLFHIALDGSQIAAITEQPAVASAVAGDLDAASNLWSRRSSNHTFTSTPP